LTEAHQDSGLHSAEKKALKGKKKQKQNAKKEKTGKKKAGSLEAAVYALGKTVALKEIERLGREKRKKREKKRTILVTWGVSEPLGQSSEKSILPQKNLERGRKGKASTIFNPREEKFGLDQCATKGGTASSLSLEGESIC